MATAVLEHDNLTEFHEKEARRSVQVRDVIVLTTPYDAAPEWAATSA